MRKKRTLSKPLKAKVDMGPIRQNKSPFEKQYLQFQKRFSSQYRCRLPSLGDQYRKKSLNKNIQSEDYLFLARQLKQNKMQILFGTQQRNEMNAEEEGNEDICEMKMMIDRMKTRCIPTQQSQRTKLTLMHQSYQLTPYLNIQTPQPLTNPSRQLTTALKEVDQNNPINFLHYKKGKRERTCWGRND